MRRKDLYNKCTVIGAGKILNEPNYKFRIWWYYPLLLSWQGKFVFGRGALLGGKLPRWLVAHFHFSSFRTSYTLTARYIRFNIIFHSRRAMDPGHQGTCMLSSLCTLPNLTLLDSWVEHCIAKGNFWIQNGIQGPHNQKKKKGIRLATFYATSPKW